MAFTDDFLDMCPHTIVWKPMISRDKYAKPFHGDPQTFRGRRVFEHKRVQSQGRGSERGQAVEVLSTSTIWILGTPAVSQDDLIYVDGDDLTRLPDILSWERFPDEDGECFVKVYLGSALG
jgi:hypothetical protein